MHVAAQNVRASPTHVAACQAEAERTWQIHFLQVGEALSKGGKDLASARCFAFPPELRLQPQVLAQMAFLQVEAQ